MSTFGLLGKNIAYSFSRTYFSKKFKALDLSHSYVNFDLDNLADFRAKVLNTADLRGFNVTIPYKTAIMDLLDDCDQEALDIGAVNTVRVEPSGVLTGFNTDHYGFTKALEPLLPTANKNALILGTGGAANAIAYALSNLDYQLEYVSRTGKNKGLTYTQLDKNTIADHSLIINCTPLGTLPDIATYPDIPYKFLSSKHLLFDLVYNPEVTRFMEMGAAQEARVTNGYQMLVYQAEKAWEIWNS